MSTDERTRRPPGSATTISRRRFLERTAFATAVASVPYLAGRSAAFGDEKAKGADAALDRALEDLVAMEDGPPGVIAVVQRGRQRKVHTFGVRNTKSGLPMRVDDRMRIASVAKAFSGAVALSLVSKGALSLNDTIGKLLSALPEPPPDAWAEVTLRQLLNHTSGLPDILEDQDFLDAFLASLDKAPPPEKLLSYLYNNDPPLRFDPGSEYQYSNSDNIAVALMVEAATGTSYEDQLQKRVYKPLGLKRTSLPRGTDLKKPFIHGYDNDPSQDPPDDISEDFAAGWAWASGGIVSTAADLNAFIRGYVGGKPRLRGRQALRRAHASEAETGRRGGKLRTARTGEELCRAGHLPL
jgi:D-alanyl-D-alanine carboxypeptidase